MEAKFVGENKKPLNFVLKDGILPFICKKISCKYIVHASNACKYLTYISLMNSKLTKNCQHALFQRGFLVSHCQFFQVISFCNGYAFVKMNKNLL